MSRVVVPGGFLFAALFAVAVLRIPEALFRAEFWADDGHLYSDALAHGAASILTPYAGYLLLGTRTVAWFESLIPPLYAPLLGNLFALLLLAAVATFASSPRMPWERLTGTIIGFGIVLLPASFQIIGTLSHLQWPGLLWMALVALSRDPETPRGRAAEGAGLVAAGLTGPGAILLLPLFVRSRRRGILVAAVALVQLAVVLTAGRVPAVGTDLLQLPAVVVLRIFTVPLTGPALVFPALVGVGVAIAVLLLLMRSSVMLPLAYLIVVPPIAGLLATEFATAAFLDPSVAPRYFWLAGAALVILLATQRHRLVAWPLIGLFLLGAVTHFTISVEPAGWAQRSACIGSTEPCSVPVVPGADWTVEWPGR